MKSRELAENVISIRNIQHFMYCPHRWGLIEIDRAWAENYFVTKANIMHERVHDPENHYNAHGRKVYTAVPVYNDEEEYNLYGVVDCFEESDKGFCIVEYKPTKPKDADYHEDDLMQVFAQKICIDHIFRCDCNAVLYYGDVKRRVKLPLREKYDIYDARLKDILTRMRDYMERGEIPEIDRNQHCNGCSMKDLCMPKVRSIYGVRKKVIEVSSD